MDAGVGKEVPPARRRREPVAAPPAPCQIDSADQEENQHDDQDEPESAAGIIAPVPAVRPGGKRPNQKQDEKNQEYRSKRHNGSFCGGSETRARVAKVRNRASQERETKLKQSENIRGRRSSPWGVGLPVRFFVHPLRAGEEGDSISPIRPTNSLD